MSIVKEESLKTLQARCDKKLHVVFIILMEHGFFNKMICQN